MNAVSAVILAGGRSSRMGLPKAALPFGPSTILERLIDTLSGTFAEIIVVAAPLRDEPFSIDRTLQERADRADLSDPAHLIIERDDAAFEGPVHAMRRGLARARGEIVFACSCDLPLLRSEVAAALCAMPWASDDALIPQMGVCRNLYARPIGVYERPRRARCDGKRRRKASEVNRRATECSHDR